MPIPSNFIGKSDHAPHAAPMENPCSPHGEPMPLIRGYLASLGGASRPPVHPPGTAAHGRVLARRASEAGAERQRSACRQVHAWPSRSRSTREHIRDTHGTHRGRTAHQQPLTPRQSCTLHYALWPATLRGRACYTPLQALLHYALWHAPLRAPPIALHSAGVSRL